MTKRPNPFLHMFVWGVGSGFILTMLYILFILNFGTTLSLGDTLLNPVFWQLSLFYGALPGAILGLADGINLWYFTRKLDAPITEGKIRLLRPEIYATTLALTVVLTFMVIASLFSTMSLFFLLPPFMAGIVLTYASHRYSNHLIAWAKGAHGRKSKAQDIVPDTSRMQDSVANTAQIDDMIETRQSFSERNT